jgi:hypothetical protein
VSGFRPFVIGLVTLVVGVLSAPVARAQESFPEATQATVLWSARSCYAEATWSEIDCAALLHVIRKRAARFKWPFLKMLRAYSVKNWVHGHGKQATELRLGVNNGRGLDKTWNERWFQLVSHVVDVLNGRVQDPCPSADHWAAANYSPKSPMRRVKCELPTANQFWVAVARR